MIISILHHKKFLFILVTLLILSITSVAVLFQQLENDYSDHEKQYNNMMLQEAISHFEDMLITRQWNAEHGGVYVKQKDGLQPNPYLKDNILKIDKDNTLIKINPAWMTRQLSERSNKKSNRYYKITSLSPLNPNNMADGFETEGLKYLEEHPEEKYYYKNIIKYSDKLVAISQDKNPMFNFIGRLNTDMSCLKCHADQGYKLGDLRGGIRISIPITKYTDSINLENEIHAFNKKLVTAFTSLLAIFIVLIIYLFYREQSKLNKFNQELKDTVNSKTKDLQTLNANLEDKVLKEIVKSKEKDQLIIAQSRHAAMGEMISMIAHQWRQPLGIITTDVNSMLVDIELDDIDKTMFKEYALGIIDQTDHLSQTIDDFRNFFRQEKEKDIVLPSSVVNECFKIMGDSLSSHNITYEVISNSEHSVEIFSRELLQVLINIINNAKDALDESKKDNPHICVTIKQDKHSLIILIQDNGLGINEQTLPKIFEPYFTTKENKNGTGLGLYMCKMIIELHFHGKIDVETDSSGTCFIISFSTE